MIEHQNVFPPNIFPQSYFIPEVPVGSIVAFAGDPANAVMHASPPTTLEDLGWLVCNGDALKSHEYLELFNVIGKMYDSSPDSETFKLPDYRGYFLRGLATDAKVDKGYAERKDYNDKSKPSDGIGSRQDEMIQMHEHAYTDYPPGKTLPGKSGKIGTPDKTDTYTSGLYTDDTGSKTLSGTETRPVNIYVNYIIKAKYLTPISPPNHVQELNRIL